MESPVTPRHRLSSVDLDERTATCSVCGPGRITTRGMRNGKMRVACISVRRRHDVSAAQRGALRAKWLRFRYRLTVEQFDALLEAQGGRCAICLTTDPGSESWNVDHDHACCPDGGQTCGNCIRGLLCMSCNLMLGLLKDDAGAVRRILAYLSK